MASLPPLADLVAVRSPDPAELYAIQAELAADDVFSPPWEPAPGVIAASRAFVGSREPAGDAVRRAGLLFAQGLDTALTPARDAAAIAELAAQHPQRLAEIPGDFGFVAFAPGGEATIVRSASGLVPFYIAAEGERWTVTTSLELMLRFHPGELAPDALVNAIWTSGYDAAPDRRTFLEGVRVLGRGEYAQLDPSAGSAPAFGAWWTPWAGPEPTPADEHAERLRTALLRTLERELDPDGGNLLALSGGVDSSAVGALATGTLAFPLSTLTVLPEDATARARDLRYIDALGESVNLGVQHRVEVGPDRRIQLLDEPAVPFHVLQPYLCLLRSTASQRQIRTLVGGEFADHTVGSTLTMRDWALHTSPADLWRNRRGLPTGPRDVRSWFVWRTQTAFKRPPVPWPDDLPEIIAPALRAEYADWVSDRRRRAAADDRPLPYLAMFLERQGFLGMHWEVTSALGIRRVFPFVSRELLELAFELHPSELVGPGTKRLLRSALAGDVPTENLRRPDKGHPGSPGRWLKRGWSGEVPEAVAPALAPGVQEKEELPYWDVFRITQLVAFGRAYGRAR